MTDRNNVLDASNRQAAERNAQSASSMHKEVYQGPNSTSSSSPAQHGSSEQGNFENTPAGKSAKAALPDLQLVGDHGVASKPTSDHGAASKPGSDHGTAAKPGSDASEKGISQSNPKGGDTHQQQVVQAAQTTLGDSNATAADKLGAVKALSDAGVKNVQVADKDGQMRNYEISTAKAGDRTMVGLYGTDSKGNSQVVLRGVENADGTVSQQKDSSGHNVGYEGSTWAKSMQGQSNVGVVADASNGSKPGTDATQPSPSQPTDSSNHQPKPPTDTTTNQPSKPTDNPQQKPTDNPNPPAQQPPQDVIAQYQAKGTGYYPANNAMEGGTKDRLGHPLYTLQQYLAGKAPYVSVAMDSKAGIPYGQDVSIPQLNAKYGENIPFKVVDTGSAFRGKGTSRIDICVDNQRDSMDATINGPLTLDFMHS